MSALLRCDRCGTEGAIGSGAVRTYELTHWQPDAATSWLDHLPRDHGTDRPVDWSGQLCDRCRESVVGNLSRPVAAS